MFDSLFPIVELLIPDRNIRYKEYNKSNYYVVDHDVVSEKILLIIKSLLDRVNDWKGSNEAIIYPKDMILISELVKTVYSSYNINIL